MAWLAATPAGQLHLSSATLGELQRGIERTRRTDIAKAAALELWVDDLGLSMQVLTADEAVFRDWARLMERKSDHLIMDALIAATARVHGLTVATRNMRDFEHLDVPLFDPFAFRG